MAATGVRLQKFSVPRHEFDARGSLEGDITAYNVIGCLQGVHEDDEVGSAQVESALLFREMRDELRQEREERQAKKAKTG